MMRPFQLVSVILVLVLVAYEHGTRENDCTHTYLYRKFINDFDLHTVNQVQGEVMSFLLITMISCTDTVTNELKV